MSETQPKHTVKRGVVYQPLASGQLSRNYVVLGGERVYVPHAEGDEITKTQAKAKKAKKDT